jgi:membrane-associated phospholipid phosphatase
VFGGAWVLAVWLTLQATPAPTPPPDRPITHIFQNLGHDLRALPSRDNALIGIVGGFSALTVRTADAHVAGWASAHGDSSYGDLGAVLGDGWTEAGGAIATYAVGALGHYPRLAHAGSDLIRAQAVNGLLTWGFKTAVARDRPDGGAHSFPSGHTSAAFATAAVLDGDFGWRAGVPAFAAATFIGWTRVRDSHHWLSDVVVGGAIGAIAGRTVVGRADERPWRVVPVVSRQTMAVFVIRTRSH